MAVSVGQHVHVEGWDTDIHLVTNVAGLDILSVHLQVCLLVSAQVGTGCKMFATLVTSVFGVVLA